MILHEFSMGDVEDPYLYAGFPIYEWQQTDKGKWVMAHAKGEIVFHCMHCFAVSITIATIRHVPLFVLERVGFNS